MSCFDWLAAIVEHKNLSFHELNSCVSFYGNQNSTYMVVEHFTSDTSVDQFVVDATESENSLKTILLLLARVDYDENKLLDWLDSCTYVQGDIGYVYSNEGLNVVKKIVYQD